MKGFTYVLRASHAINVSEQNLAIIAKMFSKSDNKIPVLLSASD